MPTPDSSELQLPLRVTVRRPPPGVHFCLQSGSSDLVDIVLSNGDDLSFELTVRAKPAGDGPVRFLGPFTQGPTAARFFYIRVGTLAGQDDSCWTRRVKVPLSAITWPLVEEARTTPNGILEARYQGTAKDGGPACATVRLLEGWRLGRK